MPSMALAYCYIDLWGDETDRCLAGTAIGLHWDYLGLAPPTPPPPPNLPYHPLYVTFFFFARYLS